MKITILAVGKLKENFYREAASEYLKRLSRYCRISVLEVADEKTPDGCPQAVADQIRAREAQRLLAHMPEDSYCIALDIRGEKSDSVAFSQKIAQLGLSGKSDVVFVIGGSLGLHESVLRFSKEQISFSDMTFPHSLARIILLEQLYRGFRILRGEPYHK